MLEYAVSKGGVTLKVKKLWIACLERKSIQKLVIVKECSNLKRIIKFALKADNDEYKCVFTDKTYFINQKILVPLAVTLPIEQMKKRINKKELRDFYKENEKRLILDLTGGKKEPIGFR